MRGVGYMHMHMYMDMDMFVHVHVTTLRSEACGPSRVGAGRPACGEWPGSGVKGEYPGDYGGALVLS